MELLLVARSSEYSCGSGLPWLAETTPTPKARKIPRTASPANSDQRDRNLNQRDSPAAINEETPLSDDLPEPLVSERAEYAIRCLLCRYTPHWFICSGYKVAFGFTLRGTVFLRQR